MSGGGGGGGGGGKRVRSLLKEALKCLSVGHGSKDGAQEACDLCIQILKTKEGRDNVDALLVLGKATFLLEEYDKSIKSYKKAAELKPSHLQAWKGILEVCERGKDEGSDLAALKREALVQLYEETKNERTWGRGESRKSEGQKTNVQTGQVLEEILFQKKSQRSAGNSK